ncbi:MAG: hypothetical protein B7Y99_05685 [Caulobacterales bacterium 32-69-10]|nr:MAG: hypothetical protein B7Y99_05685 [Caulobacterales bacterium 32-69-10]
MHDHQQSTRDVPTPGKKPPQNDADKAVETLDRDKGKDKDDHQEDLLDEGLEESFPASDPVSVKRIT